MTLVFNQSATLYNFKHAHLLLKLYIRDVMLPRIS